jgi:hypothetical protein
VREKDGVAMFKSEQIRVIRAAYSELGNIGLQDGWYDVRDRLFEMNEQSERRHRHGAHPPCPLSIKDAAKLFTVSHLLDGWKEPDKWDVGAILQIRTEVLYAQAYAKKHHEELADWAAKWAEPFKAVEYAELMKGAA